MSENGKNYPEIIVQLKKELKSKENDVRLAATYGKQLIEERDEALSQLEVLKQEKYSLQLRLETQTQSVKTQTSELESCMKQVNSLQIEIPTLEKEISVLKQRINNSQKEKQDLEKTVEDLQLENSSLKSKVSVLEQQIETCRNFSILNETRCEEDLPDINEYLSKIKTLEDTLGDVQYELETTKLNEKRLLQTVKELEETVLDRNKELSSEAQRIGNLQETMAELQCEVETLKLGQLDVNRRGNSMFAELDDRRKYVEKEFKEMAAKFSNMLKNYEENKQELLHCKGQLAILSSMTSRRHQEEQIKKLRNMLSEALRAKSALTEKLCRAEKALQNTTQVPVKGDQYNYLRVLNQQAQEKITKVENDLMSERMQSLDFEKRLSCCVHEIYASQEECQALKCENLKLKQEIKEMTSKPDVHISSKPKVNIEIRPGYENNPESIRLVEKALKENANPQIIGNIIKVDAKTSERQMKTPSLSNKARLHSFNADSEVTHSDIKSTESTLKEMNKQNEKVVPVADDNSKIADTPENRKVNCAQQ